MPTLPEFEAMLPEQLDRMGAHLQVVVPRKRRTPRPYMLRVLLRCGLCDRKMQGSWNHGEAYYRCRYASE